MSLPGGAEEVAVINEQDVKAQSARSQPLILQSIHCILPYFCVMHCNLQIQMQMSKSSQRRAIL